MRKVLLIAVLSVGLCVCACAKNGGITLNPSNIDWQKTSEYYHDYIAGFVAPVGGAVAAAVVPGAAPLIAGAIKQVGNLDKLIADRAANATIQVTADQLQEMIRQINQEYGKAVPQ